MPLATLFKREAGVRFHTVTGELTVKELLSFLRDIYGAPDFDPNLDSLWDLREADLTTFSFEEAKYVADFVSGSLGSAESRRWAFVVKEDSHYGLVRMYEKLMSNRSSGTVMVFRDMDKAREWLGLD